MPMANVSTGQVIAANDHNSIVAAIKGTSGENLTVFTKGADLVAANALALGTDGNYWHVTGTTTITSISSLPAGTVIKLEFDAALTLTHNATTLILQGATNYTTAAGDVFEFTSEGPGSWRETGRGLAAISAGFGAVPSLTLSTTGAAGSGNGFIRRNATLALFDTTAARAVAFGDVGTTGGVNFASPRDHGHAFAPGATIVASTNNRLSVMSTNGNLGWVAPSFTNPMSALGDLIVGGTAGAISRHAIVASTNNTLFVASTNGNLKWASLGSVFATGVARVETDETVATTGYVDLATVGPTVTITVNSAVRVTLGANIYNASGGFTNFMAFDTSGANTLAAADARSVVETSPNANDQASFSQSFVLTGLTPGSTTFKAKYAASGGTGHFRRRELSVQCLD